ncbi:MAG TPA: hypothetical protein VGF96_06235 [Terracidiphilus sp.]|jgi:hypothetical protein
MAIVVVGGGARGIGKTALVCGLIAALPEFRWVAVKITSHVHSDLAAVREESAAEQGTDTGRYLAAGARRAFLVSALDAELGERLREFETLAGPQAHFIFESNRIVRLLRADLCLAIEGEAGAQRKPSFALVEREKDATVRRAEPGGEEMLFNGAQPEFLLRDFARISEPMREWLRERINSAAPRQLRG